jgi:hypothetical protein
MAQRTYALQHLKAPPHARCARDKAGTRWLLRWRGDGAHALTVPRCAA